MPTSEKPKAEPELFFWDRHKDGGGLRKDESLHQHILDGGDHAAAEAVSRKIAKQIGLTDEQIKGLMGK